MTWSQEISQLITDVDQLTSAANVKKSALDASVASTEADKDAAAASVVAATTSAATSLTRAQESEAHKNTALAVYGTTAAQQTAVASVQASSAFASGYAASASAALQQDLSGIATALHRSPNAITSMFIYDTSKDSDGGAWTEKCQHTSWWNEPIMGKWLGPQVSEFQARHVGATLGTELVTTETDRTFTSDTGYWTKSGNTTISEGICTISSTGLNQGIARNGVLTIGKTYRVTYELKRVGSGNISLASGSVVVISSGIVGLQTVTFTAVNADLRFFSTTASTSVDMDNISVREVTALNTQSGDYFQLTTDGKFYRLWKNLLTQSSGVASTFTYSGGAILATMTNNVSIGGQTAMQIAFNGGQFVRAGRSIAISAIGQSVTISFDFYNGSNIATNLVLRDSNNTFIAGTNALPTSASWSRVSLSGTFTSGTGNIGFYIQGDGQTGNVFVKDLQLEFGPVVTTYEAKATDGSTSEVFRGNKRDFPRLAGIVAEGANVNIYDLTEPGRPMWRRFVNTGVFQSATFRNVKSVNGLIFVPSTLGFFEIGLIADQFVFRNITSKYQQDLITSLSVNRLIAIPGARITTSSTVHDVAFLLDSKTPVDPVTGMQYPILAIATLSDASSQSGVILTGETVLTIGNHGANSGHHFYRVFANGEDFWFYRNYSTGNSYGTYIIVSKSALIKYSFGNFESTASIGTLPLANFDSVSSKKAYTNKSSINIIKENNTTPNKSIFSVITPLTVYGWFSPNIRRCYIAALLEGSITPGSNLVLNGNFATGIEGWSTTGQGFFTTTWDSINQQAVSSCTTSFSFVWATGYTIATIPGAVYRVSANITQNDGFGVRLQISNSGGDFFGQSRSGVGQVFLDFIADATTSSIQFGASPPASPVGKKFSFDDVIATRRDGSRYPSLVGVELNGTLSMAKVASGTSLVGYSGWSAANYLQEPYSADLDFGTGEWSASAWVNIPATLPAVGAELITNGTFDTDISNWSVAGTSGSWVNGVAQVVASSSAYPGLIQTSIAVTIGKRYRIVATVTSSSGTSLIIIIGNTSTSTEIARSTGFSATGSTPTTLVFEWVATVALINVAVLANAASLTSTLTFDNISTKEILASVIFDRATSTGSRLRLGVTSVGLLTAEAFDGTTTRTVTTTSAYNTAQWLKAEANYTTDGSLAIRVNGREVAVSRGTPLLSLNSKYNLLTRTEEFTDATWVKTGTTVPATQYLAHDGASTADSLVESVTSGEHYVSQQVTKAANSITYTYTAYFKANTGSRNFGLGITDGTTGGYAAIFSTSGAVVSSSQVVGSATGWTFVSSNATPVSDSWFRASLTVTTNTSTRVDGVCYLIDGTSRTYTGNTANSILIWGAQLETGSTPKTYQRVGVVADFNFQAPLTIGNSFAADAPFPGSIALLKLGATVPTPEQSTFMYEQEKQLFRANAVSVLPDSGSVVDMSYDDATDRWVAISTTNESYWNGLVRTSVTAVPAGSYSKIATTSGIELAARTTTNPGVDITIPSYVLREELVKRSEPATKLNRQIAVYDYIGGFTGNITTGSTAIASVTNLTYPVSLVGARISGTGIPANTTITAVSGTTIYISAAATATTTGLVISFLDFNLPVGFETENVTSAGVVKQEGATKDYTRLFDGFIETIRFAVAPGATTWVRIQATKSIQ